MTAFQHYELHCDADGCTQTFNVAERAAWKTRELAAREGWVHTVVPAPKQSGPSKSVDFCRKHAQEASHG